MSSSEAGNTTSQGCVVETPDYVGYIAMLIGSVLLGSNLLPIKKFETGDGVFFQFVSCCAIGAYGVVFNWLIGMPEFEPFVMLSGVMWATGNMCCVLVIRSVGLGLGLVFWSIQSMLLGWASERFGWFGPALLPEIEWLQYCGIALVTLRGVISIFISTETETEAESSVSNSPQLVQVKQLSNIRESEIDQHISTINSSKLTLDVSTLSNSQCLSGTGSVESGLVSSTREDFLTRMSPLQKRTFGSLLALFSGSLYGLQFAPVTVVKTKAVGCTRDWDYAFAFYSGIFVTSLFYTVVYSIAMRNKPYINQQLLLPSFFSGLLWVIAHTCWFVANESVSQVVSYPVMNTLPALVGLFWGVVVFHEVRGSLNIALLFLVILIGIAGVLMIGFSMKPTD